METPAGTVPTTSAVYASWQVHLHISPLWRSPRPLDRGRPFAIGRPTQNRLEPGTARGLGRVGWLQPEEQWSEIWVWIGAEVFGEFLEGAIQLQKSWNFNWGFPTPWLTFNKFFRDFYAVHFPLENSEGNKLRFDQVWLAPKLSNNFPKIMK